MDPIDYIRAEIKSHFPESRELQLSSYFANHPRFNFYFSIKADYSYLLYLNGDEEGKRFTFKCLEFSDADILNELIAGYPKTGSKVFNIGKPKSTISFINLGEDRLAVTEVRGSINGHIDSHEISGSKLMQCVDPE